MPKFLAFSGRDSTSENKSVGLRLTKILWRLRS